MTNRVEAAQSGAEESVGMHADELLDSMRTITTVVDSDGTIRVARGGFGGFLGLDVDTLVGTNVFDHVAPEDADELAVYFLESAGESHEVVSLPAPFRLHIVGPDGGRHEVDIIATARRSMDDGWQWVAVLVPVALSASLARSFDLEMAGAPRDDVKRMLCEELSSENVRYTTRWMLAEFDDRDVSVITSRPEDSDLARIVRDDIASGWRPWRLLAPTTSALVELDDVPDGIRAELEARSWRRVMVAPVHVHGDLRAALVGLGAVPPSQPTVIMHNIGRRIAALVRVASLLMERWSDSDRLRRDATSDALTGLGNTRALAERLDAHTGSGALLYVDVDEFKGVNDRFGHTAGDRVLVAIAERIVQACRSGDVVTRVGGDEFVVVLDDADDELASAIGQRIVESVSRPLELADGPARISVSIGLSPLSSHDALDAADKAMLEAKRNGRNRMTDAR